MPLVTHMPVAAVNGHVCCVFVDADTTQVRKLETRQRSLDVVNDDAPEPRVVLADEAGGGTRPSASWNRSV